MVSVDDMPVWVKDMEFLTEPLEGNKASFILKNSQRLRSYFQGRPGKIGQLFAIHDRHPPDTALDPQSGVLYFIRTEEGLQDKSISLKSVASGPSKHTWKMAWGRKTHLKKWGVLYKSYRCRHMFQPKSSPPPYRMQIYMLQEHDRDASKGEQPTEGLALVQILSLQDAPLRRRTGAKRGACEIDGEFDDDEEDIVWNNNSNSSQRLSPTASSINTPGVGTAVAALPPVPKTPAGRLAALSALCSANSTLVTPANPLGARSSSHSASLDSTEALKKVSTRADEAQVRDNSARALSRSVVQRLDMNLGPSNEMDIESPSGDARAGLQADSGPESAEGACGSARGVSWGCDPLDDVGPENANTYHGQLVKGVKLNQQLATASLPRHKALLEQQYGALASCVLAEAVSGRAWGLPKVDAYAYGESMWPKGGDVTALGWAQLISLYATRERQVAEAAQKEDKKSSKGSAHCDPIQDSQCAPHRRESSPTASPCTGALLPAPVCGDKEKASSSSCTALENLASVVQIAGETMTAQPTAALPPLPAASADTGLV